MTGILMRCEMSSKLKNFLDAHGTRQSWLANRAGLSATTLSRILRGQRSPTAEQAIAISAALDGAISITDLLCPDGLPPGARA